MLIQWTPNTGLLPFTLGDDANRFTVIVEQLGGASILQSESLAGGVNLAFFPRGNVGGDFVFTSSKSYPTYDATFAQFIIEYGRLNQQGLLLLTQGTTVMHLANAVLKDVRRIFSGQNVGTRMGIRYTFAITTIT